jgi:hypothetical protein
MSGILRRPARAIFGSGRYLVRDFRDMVGDLRALRQVCLGALHIGLRSVFRPLRDQSELLAELFNLAFAILNLAFVILRDRRTLGSWARSRFTTRELAKRGHQRVGPGH